MNPCVTVLHQLREREAAAAVQPARLQTGAGALKQRKLIDKMREMCFFSFSFLMWPSN